MEKYYIPTIEEFHEGFEYEWNYKNQGWKADKFDISAGDTDYMAGNFYEFSPTCPQTICRVKHLDQKDIESCGWIYRNTNGMRNWYDGKEEWFGRDIPTSPGGRYWGYELTHDPKLNIIIIAAKTNSGDDTADSFFEGRCSNKSELRRLMKQLNIIA